MKMYGNPQYIEQQDEIRRLRARVAELEAQRDGARDALQEWLEFDGRVEPPADDAPYEQHLEYERAAIDVTERAAEALASLWPPSGR